MNIIIKVPATSANLGPGFDTLGLALDLWNQAEFAVADVFSIHIEGEGADKLVPDDKNHIVRSAQKVYEIVGRQMPSLSIQCVNRIPLGAGLGSSAAAALTGVLAANALLGGPLSTDEVLKITTDIEHHPDNAAPALTGGLVVSSLHAGKVITRQITVAPGIHITVVTPQFDLPTRRARAVLPTHVTHRDAVHNLSRAVLVTQALEHGDLDLLGQVMEDALHQPYRLPLIPGAQAAINAAKHAGAAAVALSGAGPSLIAFSSESEPVIGEAMQRAFADAGLTARIFHLKISSHGAEVDIKS
jgi:homoserine kinase